ncbi:HlyD family efflux transporter periplasmic adaptor subunit, partial [Candidatus Poribacteria bacterium]
DILKKSEGGEQQITELAKASANAGLLRAQSVLNRAKERLGWTTVIAPMSGRVVQCRIEEGEIITSGRSAWSQGPPVMVIADLSKMVVKTYVFEYDIGKVEVGQKAEIEINAYQDEIFEGRVDEISPSGQSMDNIIKFEVVVRVTEIKPGKPLLPGMTADVDIIVDARDNVLQLPLEAVDPRDTIKIRTDIKKERASKLKGQDVKVVLNSYPDKEFDGKVVEIAPARSGFSTSETTIIMKGSPKELQPETSRTADLIISDDEKIPNIEARIDSETEYFVKLIKKETAEATKDENKDNKDKNGSKKGKDKNGRNEEDKMIEVGERTQSNIEILSDLKEGDRVRVVPVGEEDDKKEED